MRPQGFLGTGEQGHLFQGNKGQNLRRTWEQRQYWGTGNIENKFSIFGEQGNKLTYFRGTRKQVPPLEGLYSIPMIRRPSVRRPSVRLSTISNIFSSETAWPIKAKFYVEPPWVRGTKVCTRHSVHMTKMAATPIYGKTPLKIFYRTNGPISTKLGM